MRAKYVLLLCLGGCIAYTYDYGVGTPYERARAPLGSPLVREEVPPAPDAYSGPQIYGLLPPSLDRPATPAPPPAPPAPPAPAEPVSGKSAAGGLRLLTPREREEVPQSPALFDPGLRELLVLGAERSPAMAFALSLGVGLGCGHYYAEDISTARAILGGELVGLGMVVLGYLESHAQDELEEADRGLAELGVLIFAGFRVYEILTVTTAARRYNQELRAKFGVGVAPSRGGAMVGARWRY